MNNKKIIKSKDVDDLTLEAVNIIVEPIAQTMSPKGGNVLYEDSYGIQKYSNDGATIAKQIRVEDPIMNQVISLIRDSSLQTNIQAGDGTSSTVVLSGELIKEGIKLRRNGWNGIDIRDEFLKTSEMISNEADKLTYKIKDDKDLFYIANVSSSNDKEIATNTVKTIQITGKEGQVYINPGYSLDTELVEDTGFIFNSGLFSPEFASNKQFSASYNNSPVFITDKRLYYENEAELILGTALKHGLKSIVIVAADFIGEALPLFIENHQKGIINIMLIKETNLDILSDLSVYLDTKIVSDRSGTLDELSINNFGQCKMVFSNKDKTIISRADDTNDKKLKDRIKELKKELKDEGDKNSSKYKDIEKRIASLTKGMVNIKVGGRTSIEINEKIMRYEDAVNATRNALDDGYVVGGGITLLRSWNNVNKKNIHPDIIRLFNTYSEKIVRQVITNSVKSGEPVEIPLQKVKESNNNFGYNSIKREVTDLVKDGIIEPKQVFIQVLNNSISIANAILTSNYRIVNELEDNKDNK